ncbi:hypothetical protein EDD99_7209 [Streptomyces sp. 846.5]|nr:CU044_5270 family protein [Streptomyces sp. 846.5]TDT95381.1 hypothetical protein EDD99_7209 [Streptomyces sp. 846.5]
MSADEELARLLPAPGDPELPGDRHALLREHLMREIQSDTSTDTTPARAPHRRPVRRFLVTAGTLTAAALVAALVVDLGGASGPSRQGGSSAPVVGVVPAGSHEQAVTLLTRIAEAADTQSTGGVNDRQFVYIDSKVAFMGTSVGSSGTTVTLATPHDRKVWLSVDGSQSGLLEEPQNAGMAHQSLGGNARPGVADPTYRYLAGLPTDPAALLKLIYAQTKGEGSGPDAEAFVTIGDLLRESLAPPKVSAAIYRAAALIPGVVEVPDSVDASGRHGVAVARVDPADGVRTEWIFDKKTLSYLGEREVQVADTKEIKPGTVLGYTAVITRAVVDQAGRTS